MIQIDVVNYGFDRYCILDGRPLTEHVPLTVIRRLHTSLQLRFKNVNDTGDTEVNARMLGVMQCALTIGDRVLALTDSGFTLSAGSDGVPVVTLEHLVTDTAPVRRLLADEIEKSISGGVPCRLEFSSRETSADSELALWFAIPVRLFNPAENQALPAEDPEMRTLYLTAAETRAAIREEIGAGMPVVALENTVFFPEHGKIYAATPVSGDTFIFAETPEPSARLTFELHLTQPEVAVSFSWGNDIWWMNSQGVFASENGAPDFSAPGQLYALVFRYDGVRWLGNLAYRQEV